MKMQRTGRQSLPLLRQHAHGGAEIHRRIQVIDHLQPPCRSPSGVPSTLLDNAPLIRPKTSLLQLSCPHQPQTECRYTLNQYMSHLASSTYGLHNIGTLIFSQTVLFHVLNICLLPTIGRLAFLHFPPGIMQKRSHDIQLFNM